MKIPFHDDLWLDSATKQKNFVVKLNFIKNIDPPPQIVSNAIACYLIAIDRLVVLFEWFDLMMVVCSSPKI
jgi:hypothetical protein